MNHAELEGVLRELVTEVGVTDWDETLGVSVLRSDHDIAHDLLHALERYGYTLVRKRDE